MSSVLYSVFSFIGFLLCVILFPSHFKARSVGTCLYMLWTGPGCLILCINSIVWNDNAINWAPVWCDITMAFLVGAGFGIPATSLCINRQLYFMTSTTAAMTRNSKNIEIIVELVIGVGIPVLLAVLHYITQGHRFDIFEGIGCYPSTFATTTAVVLVLFPPLIIGLISAVYCCRSIKNLWRAQSKIKELAGNGNHEDIGLNRFYRLIALAGIELLGTVPFSIYNIYLSVGVDGTLPWGGWVDTHAGWQRVDQYPAILLQSSPGVLRQLERWRWLFVACVFLLFAIFGFAAEARDNYRSAFRGVSRAIGLPEPSYYTIGLRSTNFGSSARSFTSETSSDETIV